MNRRRLLLMMGGGEKYLLRDDFSDTLAAGSVNGTLAVPGPGTRVAVDTENKISQSGGSIVFAGGKAVPAWSDPAMYDSCGLTDAPGLLFVIRFIYTSGEWMAGYSRNASVALAEVAGAIYLNGNLLGIQEIGITQSLNITLAPATVYTLVVASRSASGTLFLIKGGVHANFTLFYIGSINNGVATLYQSFVSKSGNFSANYSRVPVIKWLPIPLASDGMTSATLTDGLGHAEGVAGGIGSGGANVPWTTAATWAAAGGVAANTPTLGAEQSTGNLVVGTWYKITLCNLNYFYVGSQTNDTFRATATTALDANNKVKAMVTAELFRPLNTSFTPDVVALVKEVAFVATRQSGIAIRLNDPTTPTSGIIAYFDGLGNVKCVEFSGATYTQLFMATKAFAANDSLQLIADGVKVRLIHLTSAGVATLIGSTAAATITAGGYHGLFSTDSGNTLDNLVIYPRGTGNEFAILDRWSK